MQIFTDENFESEVLKAKGPIMVDFFAEWCGPCKMLAPTIEELEKEYEGQWTFGKLDIDSSPATAEKYGIMSIPSLLFFKDGQVVDKSLGFVSKDKIKGKLV